MKRSILIVFLLLLSFPATAQEAPAKTLRILSFNVRIWTRDRDAGSEVYWRTRMEARTDVPCHALCAARLQARFLGEYQPSYLCAERAQGAGPGRFNAMECLHGCGHPHHQHPF